MELPKIQVLYICDFDCFHSNLIIKDWLSLFEGKIGRNGNIGLILASNVNITSDSESASRICPLSQISAKFFQK